jgi:hypothetical protein
MKYKDITGYGNCCDISGEKFKLTEGKQMPLRIKITVYIVQPEEGIVSASPIFAFTYSRSSKQ